MYDNCLTLYNLCKKGCRLWPVRACPPKLLVIDGPGAQNGYSLYHNDYKAGWQAEEDLGSTGADSIEQWSFVWTSPRLPFKSRCTPHIWLSYLQQSHSAYGQVRRVC
jgi:hypothetical protein